MPSRARRAFRWLPGLLLLAAAVLSAWLARGAWHGAGVAGCGGTGGAGTVRYEFLRRENGGLTCTPQQSPDLSGAGTARFFRVVVSLP